MLELKKIRKVYKSADEDVIALKNIDIKFRKNEFVSILGPSGCGKTTLLNIIGGLDDYTNGDLIINGKSTKDYKDHDWDTYRNHSVGFVFQSYNLISHQTVLSNVELALTLSGVGKKERRRRAKAVLKKVGLSDQIHKKPNQMSGGQMQRVAIARALVNDPDILLADEPTGALDSKTSIQIMDLLKEIAQDKLVIMVTHNPELAKDYSTRIVKLLDGKITDDSNPFNENEITNETLDSNKTYMSFKTALSLSLNNLMTKKGRTFLTAFAGSIGIIGIALIMSLSNGVQNYIDRVEKDTLSTYPLTIEKSSVNFSVMMEAIMGVNNTKSQKHNDKKIHSQAVMNDVLDTVSSKMDTNNLKDFKTYLEKNRNKITNSVTAIEYDYNLKLNVYNENGINGLIQVNPSIVLDEIGLNQNNSLSSSMLLSSKSNNDIWFKMLDNKKLRESQYDIVKGSWPKNYNEVVLMVDENNEISDYTLYSLGLMDLDELTSNFQKLLNGEKITKPKNVSYNYDELLNMTFKLVLNNEYYEKKGNMWVDKSNDKEYINELIKNSEEIKIVGIIKPNEETVIENITGGVYYTKELEEYVINRINNSDIVKEQKNNKDFNIFTGSKFLNSNEEFDYNNLTIEQKKYFASLSQEELAKEMIAFEESMKATYESNLQTLGAVDLNDPASINIYPKDFDSKEIIADFINEYNKKQKNAKKEENVINYNDIVGTMMSSVSNIVNIISYVLIAFVGVSLVVSSIMIGIITYISVLERTKEIGILRSIGASKKDISRVFNAETLIIGLVAGVIGILATLLLNIPINIILKHLINVSKITSLPVTGAILLIFISVLLTLIGGLIPAKVASKKDPVEALRSE